ncbi:GDP-6-deoxy-D-mannose reductase [Cohnella sp. JJ-181]|nr:GDP-6-deoxy-D-mannose reductase [Cohnella sp. JJ-181]
MRVLVTGAAGFSGRHACERLALEGMEVAAVVSPRASADDGRPPVAGAVAELPCDLTDRASVLSLLAQVRPDAVLHLAGRNAVDESWRAPDQALAANLMSTVYLLEGARALPGCRTLVVGSMLSPRPGEDLARSLHPYGFSKALQVTAALAWHHWYGQPVVVAEPCNLIGPGGSTGICGKIARWAAACELADEAQDAPEPRQSGLRQPEPFRLSSLDERRDFLDVRDAAAAYAALLRSGASGCSYALESGTLRSLGEVKEAFDLASRVPLRWEIGASGGPSPQPRDASAARAIGWRPEIPFARSIADTLQSERERLAAGN